MLGNDFCGGELWIENCFVFGMILEKLEVLDIFKMSLKVKLEVKKCMSQYIAWISSKAEHLHAGAVYE